MSPNAEEMPSKEGQDASINNERNNSNSNERALQLLEELGAMSDGIDVDVDDLLSDESDNDDLIDNEADLALLLRTHGVSLDESPAPLSHVSQRANSSLISEGNQSMPTSESSASNLAADWTGMIGRHKETSQQQKSSIHDVANTSHSDYNLSTLSNQPRSISSFSTPTISTSTSSTSWSSVALPTISTASMAMDTDNEADSEMDYQDFEHEGREGATPIGTGESLDAEPTPFVMDPEDNKRLTSIIRSQTAHALEVNRKYQQALEQKLKYIETAYNRNKKLRNDLQVWLDRRELADRAPVLLHSTNDRLGRPPYFVDNDGQAPPDNMDTIRKKSHPLIISQRLKSWTKMERERLKQGVIAENKRLLFEKFLQEGNSRAIESLNHAPDVDMMINTKGLDWKRISQRYVDSRTPSECLIRWTSHDHPGINKSDWSKAELLKLDNLVQKYKGRNWVQIALDLDTNRTSAQCFQKYQSKLVRVASKDNWTPEEDNILTEAVRVLGEKNWQQVAYCLDNRNSIQCMTRWSKSVNPAIRRGRWLSEEDGALRAAYEAYGGGRWAKIQQHVLGRTDIQCRERYMNVLTPNLATGPWTKEEVELLDQLVEEHGEKWALVASLMNGRTDNQCARRWKMTKIEAKKKSRGRPKRYLASRRRKGTTTVSVLPTASEDKEAIQETMSLKRRWEKKIQNREMKFIMAKRQFDYRQDRRIQPLYKSFLKKERFIYDCFNEQWGNYIDPIEKVFNIGVPPIPCDIESTEENSSQVSSIWDNTMQDSATIARPGKVRPVPPCYATLTAFSNLIQQGNHLGGRFQLSHTIADGNSQTVRGQVLTTEEQKTQEYKELEERFESVFTWPLLSGMLHMESARELVDRAQAEAAATKRGSRTD
ncbi:Myb-like DNA-binding domain protein [Linnemannia zychae]|nr:Myb-like DNA-binding domain protein [Linnemannia zychae]